MTDFTYSLVPEANNDPSADQPTMLVNTTSIRDLIAVDHVSFNSIGGGQHLQVTFNSKNVPGAVIDPVSVLYTNFGMAGTISQVFYENQNGIIPISALKAFGYFSNGVGFPLLNGINLSVFSNPSPGVFDFSVPVNILTGTFYSIFADNPTNGTTTLFPVPFITGASTFTITYRSASGIAANPTSNFAVQVLQI